MSSYENFLQDVAKYLVYYKFNPDKIDKIMMDIESHSDDKFGIEPLRKLYPESQLRPLLEIATGSGIEYTKRIVLHHFHLDKKLNPVLLVGLKDILDTLYRFAIFRKPVKQTVKHWFFKLYPQVRLQDIKNHVENINDSYSDMGRFDDLPINKLERLVLAAKKYYGYRFSIDEMVSEIAPYTKEDPVTIRRCVVQLYRRRSDTSRRARLAVDIIEGARYLISTYKEKRAAKLEAKVIVVLERCDSLEDAIKELMFKFYPHCSEEEIRTAVNDRIQE